MEIKIREMCVKDAEGIISILNPIIHDGLTVIDGPLTVKQEKKFLKNFPKKGIFYVAIHNDKDLIGFQVLEPFENYAHAFDHVATIGTYVNISERRQGIGTELSYQTFKKSKEKGFEKIFTYVLAENKHALQFYLKLGFKIIGKSVQQAKLNGKYLDEIIIEKFL